MTQQVDGKLRGARNEKKKEKKKIFAKKTQ